MLPLRQTLRAHTTAVFTLAALAALALLYGPHLAGRWVWDDVYLVRDNASLRAWSGLGAVLGRDLWGGATGRATELYHPLPMFTLWAQARLAGVALVPMRALNVALHALCGAALFAWLRRRGTGAAAACVAAGAFVLHPSATEPVQWITGRHDTLGTLCALGALLCVRPGVAAGARAWGACGLLCTLALLCKEPYVVAPAVVLLARVLEPGGAPRERAVLRALPFAGAAAVFALRAALGIRSGSAQLAAPLLEHARNYASIVAHYVAQLALGRNGSTIETYAPLGGGASVAVLLGVGLATGALAWGALRGGGNPRSRGALLGWLWFLLALAPHVVALPIIGQWGNRYGYFPGAGLAVVLAFAVDALAARLAARERALGVVLVGLVFAVLGVRTWGEAAAWRDDLTLYGRDVARAPGDGRARYHYALALQRRRGCAEALPEFARATRDAPDYARGWHNLAGCLINLGRFAEAVVPARVDAALAPDNARALYNLGVALALSGRAEEAVGVLARAVALDPGYAPAREALAEARRRSGTAP